jgi:hypothetical protein
MSEFMALGNHRRSIRAEIAEVSDRVRQVELDALRTNRELADDNLSLDAFGAVDQRHPEIPQPRESASRRHTANSSTPSNRI